MRPCLQSVTLDHGYQILRPLHKATTYRILIYLVCVLLHVPESVYVYRNKRVDQLSNGILSRMYHDAKDKSAMQKSI